MRYVREESGGQDHEGEAEGVIASEPALRGISSIQPIERYGLAA